MKNKPDTKQKTSHKTKIILATFFTIFYLLTNASATWWNDSYNYKREINCSSLTDGLPIVVNGSGGFTLSGNNQVVWTYCSGTGTAVYYNAYNDYVIANDTTQIPMAVEQGNESSYNPARVWSSKYEAVYLFTNTSDYSGNNYNLQRADGNPTTTSGKIGGAYIFDGDDSLIYDTSASIDLSLNDDKFTLCHLIKSNSDSIMTVIKLTNNAGNVIERIDLGINSAGSIRFWVEDDDGRTQDIEYTDSDYTTGNWLLYCGVRNGSNVANIHHYVNGVEDTVTTSDIHEGVDSLNDVIVQIKVCENSNDRYYNGIMDYSFIYNDELTPNEINQIYQNINSGAGYGDLCSRESPNQAPKTPTPSITPSTVYTNTSIVYCNATVADVDSSSLNVTFTFYNGSNVLKTWTRTGVASGSTLDINVTNYTLWVKGNTLRCTVSVTDNHSESSNGSTTKTVGNLAPQITIEQTTVSKNNSQTYTYDYNATDLDVDDGVDTLTWSDNTTLFDINSSTGEITDTPAESEAGTYYIRVSVSDGSTQVNDSFTYTITDINPPSVTINNPTSTTYSSSTNVTMNITATDTNNISVCWYSLNSWATNSSFTCSASTTITASEGSNTLLVGVNDSYGNINNTESVSFIIDTTGPNITLLSPENDSNIQVNTSRNFKCYLSDYSNISIALFYWNYGGNWTLNGTESNISGNSTTVTFTKNLTALGNYTWNCWANDTHGKGSWGANNYTFTVSVTTSTTTSTTTTTTRKSSSSSGSSSSGAPRSSGGINQPAESCYDGLKNQDEEGVDCGGTCKPCATCSDGIQNQGEDGVDCGGPCDSCKTKTTTVSTTTTSTTHKTTSTTQKKTTTSTTQASTTTELPETTTTTQPSGTVPLGVTSLAVGIIMLFAVFLILLKKYK
ncbi:MAG: hypothetical protein B6U97_01055 [Candidatus Altiarchaeales archaeon ex4484_96]|nr:MAG: hypothetical protein B6U97_01055 [Candidatus Altiarchaeales archaeon ex4484_96]